MAINRKTVRKIAQLKKEAEMTWDELAARAGIPVSSWMAGTPAFLPSEDEVRKIAAVLGTTYEALTGDK